jgi:tRNA pseudouridine38-40 synthase
MKPHAGPSWRRRDGYGKLFNGSTTRSVKHGLSRVFKAMPTWKLTIEYDGSRYRGWQEQKNARTIAGELRAAAMKLLDTPVDLGGAGRTDAGVHALAQVAHLRSPRRLSTRALRNGLNDNLPSDINVLRAEEAPAKFDARRNAIARYYLYQISTRRTAFGKPYCWWVKDRLDLAAMHDAAALLAGRHDFQALSDKRIDEDKSTIVVVERVELAAAGDLILFRIGASHYLWKMVRRIVGMLVEVGRGSISVDEFRALFETPVDPSSHHANSVRGERREFVASHTAPSSGLFLERVAYQHLDAPDALVSQPAPFIPS